MLAYGKTGHVSVDELNGESSVDRRIGGGYGRDEGAWVVGSRACVGRSQTRVGAGWLDTEEGFLTLGDIDRDGESVENEREEDKDVCLPVDCHDGEGYTVLEAEVSGSVYLRTSKSQERRFRVLAVTTSPPLRIRTPPEVSPPECAGNVEAFEDTQPHEHGRKASKRTPVMVWQMTR